MIFSSKVWSCSLTESLESPSLSSKLGSTEERRQEHPNPSDGNYGSGTASLLCPCLTEGRALPPFSRAQSHQEPPGCSPGESGSSLCKARRDPTRATTTSPPPPHRPLTCANLGLEAILQAGHQRRKDVDPQEDDLRAEDRRLWARSPSPPGAGALPRAGGCADPRRSPSHGFRQASRVLYKQKTPQAPAPCEI